MTREIPREILTYTKFVWSLSHNTSTYPRPLPFFYMQVPAYIVPQMLSDFSKTVARQTTRHKSYHDYVHTYQ